ncbi:predicted serine/threonine kinase [Mycoplasma sp. CAG:956]|nr:predicted serine/threonine kinase [Mycoplasma sp. CAG:956]
MKKLDINKDYNNGGSLYLEDGYLYKVYDEISYFRDEKERNIKFLMNNSIPNTPKIYKMLYKNNEFNGYIMEYIEGSMTFRDGMKQEISFSDKIKAILDVYETLKVLHSYNICIGDIHLSNFLYKDGHGYVIDLDEIRYPEDNFKFRERYLVKESIKSVPSKQASFITDNIKVCICCLSFLYNIDLENIICKYSLKSVKIILKLLTSDEEYKEISKVLDINKLCYFDDILTNRVNISRVLKR